MSQRPFAAFQQEVFQLYFSKDYAGAAALVRREGDQFPDHARLLFHWTACFEALAGNAEGALKALEEAVARGFWYAEAALMDTDLQTLHGRPAFENLVAICRARFEEARANVRPEMIIRRPERGDGPFPTLVVLHGNHTNARDTVDFWQPAAQDGWLMGLPSSTQLDGQDSAIWTDLSVTVPEVQQHVSALLAAHPVDRNRLVLGGFSMGGHAALRMGLSGEVDVRGLVLMAPWVENVETMRPFLRNVKPGLRVYIICGDQDEPCLQPSRNIAAMLKAEGIACELEIVPGVPHFYPGDFAERMRRGLAFVMGE